MKEHTPNKITIHCTDTPNGKQVSLEAIESNHVAQGFGGIGYHTIIQPDGEIVITRPYNTVGAHVAGSNTGNVGICLAGKDRFTRAQMTSLLAHLRFMVVHYQIDDWNIFCHAQFPSAISKGKDCPGIPINRMLHFVWTEDFAAISEYLIKETL